MSALQNNILNYTSHSPLSDLPLFNIGDPNSASAIFSDTNSFWNTASDLIGSSNTDSLISNIGGSVGGGFGNFLSQGSGIFGSLLSGVSSLFSGSPPSAFTHIAVKFLQEVVPNTINSNKANPEKMMTDLSSHYNYTVLNYTAHLKGSTGSNSKKGNAEGLNMVKSFLPKLRDLETSLKSYYNVFKKRISITFPRDYHPQIPPFNGDHKGSYDKYTLTQKKTSKKTTGSNDDDPKESNSTAFVVIVLVVVFWKKIKRFLKL